MRCEYIQAYNNNWKEWRQRWATRLTALKRCYRFAKIKMNSKVNYILQPWGQMSSL